MMRDVEEDGKTVNFDELNVQGHKIRDPSMQMILPCYPILQGDHPTWLK